MILTSFDPPRLGDVLKNSARATAEAEALLASATEATALSAQIDARLSGLRGHLQSQNDIKPLDKTLAAARQTFDEAAATELRRLRRKITRQRLRNHLRGGMKGYIILGVMMVLALIAVLLLRDPLATRAMIDRLWGTAPPAAPAGAPTDALDGAAGPDADPIPPPPAQAGTP